MTDKKDLAQYVRKLFRKHKWMVTNLGWKVNLNIYNGVDQSDQELVDALKHTSMMVYRQWGYLSATLCVFLDNLIHNDENEVETILLHELCHILVSPMRENETEISEEHVVTSLARIMLRLQGSNKGIT